MQSRTEVELSTETSAETEKVDVPDMPERPENGDSAKAAPVAGAGESEAAGVLTAGDDDAGAPTTGAGTPGAPTGEAPGDEPEAAETGDVASAAVATAEGEPAADPLATAEGEPATDPVATAEGEPATDPVATAEGEPSSTDGAGRPGVLPNWWTDAYPQVTDVRSATAYLDAIGGAMSRKEQDGRWVLWTGEQVLFEADTPAELDGFILGFALSQLIAERHGPISQVRRR